MNRFEWVNATSVAAAATAAGTTVADATLAATRSRAGSAQLAEGGAAGRRPDNASVIKAGGVDLVDLLKEGIVAPSRVVNILRLQGLDRITRDTNGVRIGALVTVAQLAADAALARTHAAMVEAASHIATPQVRNVATVGGNLLQRPKCWYFRNAAFPCLRKGGDTCYAQGGENEFHAIFANDICAIFHPSTLATPLVAMNAEAVLVNAKGEQRVVRLEEFFITPDKDMTRENTLRPGEVLTEVRVPALGASARSAHHKQGEKESFDWPIADVAVVLEGAPARVTRASIVLGAAAPVPWRARAAEALLVGKAVTEQTAREAASAAIRGATPLSQNAYKLPIFEAVVRRTILRAAGV